MLGGIQEILIISTPQDLPQFENLLGDGSQWGLKLSYKEQPSPDGLAQAFILGEDFIGDDLSTLILGDNIFYGHDLGKFLHSANTRESGATVFAYHVNDPERYGVAEFNTDNQVISWRKNQTTQIQLCGDGSLFYDQKVVELANHLKPSARGELEITDLNKLYLDSNELFVEMMDRGYAWLDTGTHDSLLDARSIYLYH